VRCNCGGRADEVGGDGGPDVFLLGEGTEAAGVWIGRRGLIRFMQTGCFGLLGGFLLILCANIVVFYNSAGIQMKHVSWFGIY
jgi:hypothetical protein